MIADFHLTIWLLGMMLHPVQSAIEIKSKTRWRAVKGRIVSFRPEKERWRLNYDILCQKFQTDHSGNVECLHTAFVSWCSRYRILTLPVLALKVPCPRKTLVLGKLGWLVILSDL
jgi:hypothetical protein